MGRTVETVELEGDVAVTPATPIALSNMIARIHKQYVGRGPVNSRILAGRDVIVCLLEHTLTTAERTLTEHDRRDLVTAGRSALQDSMRQALVAEVEALTGRRARSFMSASDPAEDLQVMVFVLEPRGVAVEQSPA